MIMNLEKRFDEFMCANTLHPRNLSIEFARKEIEDRLDEVAKFAIVDCSRREVIDRIKQIKENL